MSLAVVADTLPLPQQASRSIHCLIVDADANFRHVLKTLFSVRGFTAWEASNFEEAEIVLREQNAITGLLLSINRENENGLATYAKLRMRKPNLWCCFLCDSEKVEQQCAWPADSTSVVVRHRANLVRIIAAARDLDAKLPH